MLIFISGIATTPLHEAANGYKNIAVQLIRASADPDKTSRENKKPLDEAIIGGKAKVVKAILEQKVDVNKPIFGTLFTPPFFGINFCPAL